VSSTKYKRKQIDLPSRNLNLDYIFNTNQLRKQEQEVYSKAIAPATISRISCVTEA